MVGTFLQRLMRPVVQVQESESVGVLLMFLYSFLAMTAYNMLKPLTRSQFIRDLGADNLPYVLLAAGVLIGILMQGYSRGVALLPRRWVISTAQIIMAGVLVGFWFLFKTDQSWVSAAFYLLGLMLGILLISQFWTLANDLYDPRQAKRVFGFIGGGAALGGMAGSAVLANQGFIEWLGTTNLLLLSALLLVVCAALVAFIIGRSGHVELGSIATAGEEKGVGGKEALRLLRESKHLQIISLVIGFAAIGAAIIEQQLNLASSALKDQGGAALESFLGQVQFYLSLSGFIIQIWLTSRIHRYLGIGFALMILPFSLGTTGLIMLFNASIWAPAAARILDSSLRYTVDKTTREILFLPLPTDLKYSAKPFVDVTVDRFAKGLGALIILVLIKPWGFNLGWQQLSYASLTITVIWIMTSFAARRGYIRSFRESIERHVVEPSEVRLTTADLSTVETLIEELADPDEQRVLYAIDVLESLDKRNLVTPLLLYHASPKVRARALAALGGARTEVAERWLPNIEKMIGDEHADVRRAAVGALATLRPDQTIDLLRPYLASTDHRLASSAAVVLARSPLPVDVEQASATFERLAAQSGPAAALVRRDVAAALAQVGHPRFNHLLIPLLYDSDPRVAEEAMASVAKLGASDFLFVPTLVSLLRDRRLKSAARDVLVGYGEGVIDVLGHFLTDEHEDLWVRRHIPATLARIPSQKSVDVLAGRLAVETDGFLRFKLLTAIERIHRLQPELTFDKTVIEKMATSEARRYFRYLSLRYNLFDTGALSAGALLARALTEKMHRAKDRAFICLGLIYPWRDVAAARWAIERGDTKARSSALEYLDNIIQGALRKQLMPMFEEQPVADKVRRANVILRTRVRNVEETLLELINDEDEIVSASAIDLVREHKVWALVDDIEHVLAHRDVRDWFVFEAASWTLAFHRVPDDRRRALWLEPLPAVELAARLRALPIFANVTVDELFRLARVSRQTRHEAGTVLYAAGATPSSMEFLLDGRVELRQADGTVEIVEPPSPIAFQYVLEGAPARHTARTLEPSVCLVLGVEEGRTLLADNTDLVQGLFRMVVDDPAFASGRMLIKGEGQAPIAALAVDHPLTPVEKVLVLQRMSLLSRFSADEILALAGISRDVRFDAGTELSRPVDAPVLTIVVTGEVTLDDEQGRTVGRADAGDAVGMYETLAGMPLANGVKGLGGGRALQIPHDELFDLLGQRQELLRQLFAALFGAARRTAAQPAAAAT